MNLIPERFFDDKELQLVKASVAHNKDAINDYQKVGVDINCIGREGMTPLIFNVIREDLEAIEILLDAGGDAVKVIPGKGSAISIACHLERNEVLKFMIKRNVDIFSRLDNHPLTWAAAEVSNRSALEILFRSGISVDARDGSGNTLLLESIMVNDIDLAEWLIDCGANVHVVNIFLISAAERLQSRMQRAGDGNNAPKYRRLMKIFEDHGVRFPVPESLELKVKLGKESITIEEASQLNELAEESNH